ncbi:MAG TPA: pyridoxamine 5'-phosphate oxidase family protein [Jatrophihabitantaceae bacterium]
MLAVHGRFALSVGRRKQFGVATWSELRDQQPGLADLGEQRLIAPGVVLVATIRHDGTPRVSPVEPLLLDGQLWLSLMLGSTKAHDLVRDPRILVHNIVTSRDGIGGEFKVRGRAQLVENQAALQHYVAAVGRQLGYRMIVGRFHLFTIDIHDVTFIRYDGETGDQYVARWPNTRQFVRRSDSATSVGPPEATAEALASPIVDEHPGH